jgi:hypothetical protein
VSVDIQTEVDLVECLEQRGGLDNSAGLFGTPPLRNQTVTEETTEDSQREPLFVD